METKLRYIVISVEGIDKDNSNENGIDLKVILQDYPKYVGHIFVYRNLRFVEKSGDIFVEVDLEHIKPGGITVKKDENNKIDDEVEKLMKRLIEQIINDILGTFKKSKSVVATEDKENGVSAN